MYVQELSPCTYKYSIDVKCSEVNMFRINVSFVALFLTKSLAYRWTNIDYDNPGYDRTEYK